MRHVSITLSPEIRDLGKVLLGLQSDHEIICVLFDLYSQKELQTLAERWTIAKLMSMGFSYRKIAAKTGASSTTIARVAKRLQEGTGVLQRVCKRREVRMARHNNLPLLLRLHRGAVARDSTLSSMHN